MLADALDFVVIGVMKSGTTSIENNLRSCENSALIPNHYGTRPDLFGDNIDRAYEQYALDAVARIHERHGKAIRIGHIKGTYHATPSAMDALIAKPHLKLVLTYRDPVGRLYSHYNHELKQGYTRLNFEDWTKCPMGREGIQISSLGACLESFADRLDRDRFRIMSIAQTAEPADLGKLCDFLGIGHPRARPAVSHATKVPRSRFLNYLARQSIDGVLTRGTRLNGRANRVREILLQSKQKPARMDPETKARWTEYFAKDFQKFEELSQPFRL